MNDPRAGQLAQPVRPRRPRRPRRRPTTTAMPDPDDLDQQVAFGTSGPPRVEPEDRVQRGAHRRHDPGDLRLPARRRATTARCSSAATPTGCPSRPGRPPSRCWPPTTSVLVDARDGYTPTPAVSARDPPAQPRQGRHAARARPRRRHRRHPVAQPAARRRLQVQPAARRPRGHRRDEGHRRPRQRADRAAGSGTSAACRSAGARRHTRSPTTSCVVRRGPGQRHRPRRDPDAGVRIGADPLGGASVELLGRDRRAPRPRPDRREPPGRPARGGS